MAAVIRDGGLRPFRHRYAIGRIGGGLDTMACGLRVSGGRSLYRDAESD